MQAKQLPTIFNQRDMDGVVLHLRCDYTREKTPTGQTGFAQLDTQLVLMGVQAGQMTMRVRVDATLDRLYQEVRRLYQLSGNIQFTLELNGPRLGQPCKLGSDPTATVRDLPGFDATQYRQLFCLWVRCAASPPPVSGITQGKAGPVLAQDRDAVPTQQEKGQADHHLPLSAPRTADAIDQTLDRRAPEGKQVVDTPQSLKWCTMGLTLTVLSIYSGRRQ